MPRRRAADGLDEAAPPLPADHAVATAVGGDEYSATAAVSPSNSHQTRGVPQLIVLEAHEPADVTRVQLPAAKTVPRRQRRQQRCSHHPIVKHVPLDHGDLASSSSRSTSARAAGSCRCAGSSYTAYHVRPSWPGTRRATTMTPEPPANRCRAV